MQRVNSGIKMRNAVGLKLGFGLRLRIRLVRARVSERLRNRYTALYWISCAHVSACVTGPQHIHCTDSEDLPGFPHPQQYSAIYSLHSAFYRCPFMVRQVQCTNKTVICELNYNNNRGYQGQMPRLRLQQHYALSSSRESQRGNSYFVPEFSLGLKLATLLIVVVFTSVQFVS